MTRLLGGEGVDSRTLGRIYMKVVQAVLLYGSETWVMAPHIGRDLSGFHHSVALSLAVWQPYRGIDERWSYPPLEEAMEYAGLQEVDTYVSHRQKTVTQFTATRTIIDLCMATERHIGLRVYMWWWYQEGP